MKKDFIEKMILKMIYFLKVNELYVRMVNSPGAQILAYHEVSRSTFDKHVKYLIRNNYQIISMEELTRFLYSNTTIPKKTISITFDDGWKSNYSEVYPVACKYRIPVIIYIISQVFVTDFKPWFFILAELKSSKIPNIPNETYLSGLDDNKTNSILKELKTQYGDKLYHSHTLSIAEIMEMLKSGFVSFGSHTLTHPNLNHIPMEEVESEIFESKKELELLLNHSVDHFAYPKGYFSVKHFDVLRDAGYRTAVTIMPGWNNPIKGTNPFALRRIFMSAKDDVPMLSAKLSGLWYKILRKRTYHR